MGLQLVSVCPGMAWDPGSAWSGSIQGNAADEQAAAPESEAQEPRRLRRGLVGSQARRRARTDDGTFQADDPATPAVNEAYEEAPKLRAEAKPSREN
jgi:hypothetical protein